MVLCWVALPIFAILGIFSAKYRKLTGDSLECIFRTVLLRKCKSGLDDRIRGHLSGTALKVHPKLGKIVYKLYAPLSWLLVVLFIWSMIVSIIGVYNFVEYGNCNGPDSTGFCILDPTGANSGLSETDVTVPTDVTLPELEDDDPVRGDPNASLTIIEFGCYTCPYTRQAEPIVAEVLNHYEGKVNLQFKTYPIPSHKNSFMLAHASNCVLEQGLYEPWHEAVFADEQFIDTTRLNAINDAVGVDADAFTTCMEEDRYKHEVATDALMGVQAGVVGTPTFFINDKRIVGPKPFKTFKTLIDRELE